MSKHTNLRELQIQSEIASLKQTKAVLIDELITEFDTIDRQIKELREELKRCKHECRKTGNGG